MTGTVTFPFSALVGADGLREALLACAVDPRIGGVLVRGERGTAKTTAVRGLAPLLPPVRVFADARFPADPDADEAWPEPRPADGAVVERPVRLVELPVGATADRVVGTLDLGRALGDGARVYEPGLLAEAHRGVLYVDEVNLLPDHLVDVLLDAAATGRNHVEREGVSASHPARFLLVGTMNPEEGELRPQLLDRFGLAVDVAASRDATERAEIVRRRLAFDAAPAAFAAAWQEADHALAARITAARARLDAVVLADRMLVLISGICAQLGVDGVRADIVIARTAKALAALDGVAEVGEDHVRRAALLALAHRRRRGPFEAPGLDEAELDEALADAAGEGDDDPPDDGGGPGGGGGAPRSAPGSAADEERPYRAGAPAPERTEAAGTPGVAPLLALTGRGRGAAGRRSRSAGREGGAIDSRPAGATVTDLALVASLRAAACAGRARPTEADLREHVRAGREGNLVVFCVDASGSMGARRRMGAVKGAVLGLLLDAYQRRDRVALVTFRGAGAELVLAPTRSVERAAAALERLATGGRTPLAAGLRRTAAVLEAERGRDPDRRALALVVTDGRTDDRPAALEAAGALAARADGVVVFDAEEGPVRLGLAAELARAAGARLLPVAVLHDITRRAA